MPFVREWNECCPHVWDSWEADGVSWVIRDLRPEDDEQAIEILVKHLCPDEVLCAFSNLIKDPASVCGSRKYWRSCLSQRMSLGCYLEKDGECKLIALNVCVVECQGEKLEYVIEGKAWKNVVDAIKLCDKVDVFKLLGVDKLLYGFGLVVSRNYRGAKLGARILQARVPLALHNRIVATSTVFTGVASQKSAERAGFSTVLTVTIKELAEAGLDYPSDDTKSIKLMVKKYED